MFNIFPTKKSVDELLQENKNLEDILKSIEEDGTTEHNNAIKLRQEVASLEAFQKGLIHERDTARDLLVTLTKDHEDQKQLKDSLQRVNEKYIKKINEQADSISELAKEVNGLRHLKKENVELIERLEKEGNIVLEGNSYGMTFNEVKTQIIQNDYKKCAEERDEYKHQLNAANKEIEALKLMYEERETKLKTYNRSLQCQITSLKEEKEKHSMYPLHWGGYDGAASAYPKQYSDWLNEQKDKTIKEKYDKNIIDFVESEFSNEDPLEGKQVKQAVESLKNMKSQGFEDYDPSDFEQPVKEVEFNSEELLKRATEYADSLDSLPKSFPDEFQDEKTTAENLEERFDAGKNVLDYFDEWKCPCNKCKETKTEKSWEETASDLALKVAKLEEVIVNQLKQIEEIKAFGNKLTKMTYQDSYYEYFKKHGKWPW